VRHFIAQSLRSNFDKELMRPLKWLNNKWLGYVRRKSQNEIAELDAYIELWKTTAVAEQQKVEYYFELAEYYKSQWEQTLEYLPPEIREEIVITKEVTH
jgi:hypothetical protein